MEKVSQTSIKLLAYEDSISKKKYGNSERWKICKLGWQIMISKNSLNMKKVSDGFELVICGSQVRHFNHRVIYDDSQPVWLIQTV